MSGPGPFALTRSQLFAAGLVVLVLALLALCREVR